MAPVITVSSGVRVRVQDEMSQSKEAITSGAISLDVFDHNQVGTQ